MELKPLEYKDRIINLFGDIDESSVNEAIQKIVEINCTDNDYINNVVQVIGSSGFTVNPETIEVPPIIINLSTFGGSCYDGLALCDAIRTSATPVKVICFGKIMSMGIPILLSAHFKASHRNTTFMIHGISTYEYGKVQEIRESMEENDRLEAVVVEYILSMSKFPKRKMNEIIDKKLDFFFDVEDALKYKLIDEIIE